MPITRISQTASGQARVNGQQNVTLLLPTTREPLVTATANQTLQPVTQVTSGAGGISLIAPDVGSQLMVDPSGLEAAIADTDATRLMKINAELIKAIWDPFSCPAALLPYLAWAMGVTFWNDQWSDQTKRQWIAQQWQFKAIRGTKAAVEMAVDFAGRDVTPFGYKVTRVIRQPQKFFPSASLTKAEREIWLETLPQVRVFFFRDTPPSPLHKFFCGGRTQLETRQHSTLFCANANVCIPSTAKDHLARKAVWTVNGVDTDITVTDFGNFYQLHIPTNVNHRLVPNFNFFGHSSADGAFIVPSDAWKRLVTIEPTLTTPWRVPVGPSLKAVNAQPDIVAQLTDGIHFRFIAGSNYQHGTGTVLGINSFVRPSTAKYRLFERYAVYDPDQVPLLRPNPTFLGRSRLGWPNFTAQVDVSMSSKQSPFVFGTMRTMVPQSRFLIPHDPRPIAYVCDAINQARRMADKILLNTKASPVFAAGDLFIAGVDHYTVGQPNAK